MAHYRKRNNSWQAIVRIDGKTYSKSFERKAEAKDWATDLEDKLLHNSPEQVISQRTMADVIQKYIDEVIPTLSQPEKTVHSYKFLLKQDWVHKPLSRLTESDLIQWRDKRYKTVGAKTVWSNFNLLKTTLNYAQEP